jgi:ABC-type transporter Mla subunit MlaD
MTVIKAERPAETDQAAAAATAAVEQVEGEIRAFVRRDLSAFRRQQAESGGDAAVDNVGSVIERVAKASIGEIDRVMAELANVRDMLRGEGERVQREISSYASLSQTAMTSMKIIGDSLVQWKSQTPQVAQRKD